MRILIVLNNKKIHSIPESANLSPFRAPKPAISHFFFFGSSPENVENISNVFQNFIADFRL